jgi:6-pyruvoyltetrahydropterin/6-carboxytetrahydropterin synthase
MAVPVHEISREFTFSAAHQIRGHGGKCERLHGHNYRIRIYLRASTLNRIGLVIDFADLQRIIHEICAPFDHQNLNEIPPFNDVNTSAENISRHIYDQASKRIEALEGSRVTVSRVDVWENTGSLASYWEA